MGAMTCCRGVFLWGTLGYRSFGKTSVIDRRKIQIDTTKSPASRWREKDDTQTLKLSPSSPPDSQDPLGLCCLQDATGLGILGSPPQCFAKRRTYLQTPPDMWDSPDWDVLWFHCKVPWLETSCEPTTMKKDVELRVVKLYVLVLQLPASSRWRDCPALYSPPLCSMGHRLWSRADGAY